VSQSDDDMREALHNLVKQTFQMIYFGKMSGEYIRSLEVSEKDKLFKLLADQINEEKKAHDQANKKAKATPMPKR
jgi:flagellar biosynthesis/type III secretory pathway chaperone